MGDAFRWLTIGHPSQPDIDFVLMIPRPPLDEEAAASVRGLVEKGALSALGLSVVQYLSSETTDG